MGAAQVAAGLLEAVERAGDRAQRWTSGELQLTPYVPWWAQRQFHRPAAIDLDDDGLPSMRHWRFRVVVAARQTGKTEAGARELIAVMGGEPGTYSALLAPTYQIARAAVDKVLAIVAELGLEGWDWREQKKRLTAPNGSVFAVFSADRKETVRGPTITGLLWIDEAAFLAQGARDAAYGALTGNMTARVVITTTPKGMNWVHGEFTADESDTMRLRFRSSDSPYTDQALVERLRRSMSAEMFAQEFEAEFVESLLLPFPSELRDQLWVDPGSFEARDPATAGNVLGVDLGREQDWCVVTLCNDFGEATPLARWQRERWPETLQRVLSLAQAHKATCVIDTGGPAGGPGGVLADFLEDKGVEVVRVRTNHSGTKGQIVEQCRADAQWNRLHVVRNEHFQQLDHELGVFQGVKRVYQGREIHVYEGPQVPGEHDDCVISLCLANWGRHVVEKTTNPLSGDWSGWLAQPGANMGATGPRPSSEGPGWGEAIDAYRF